MARFDDQPRRGPAQCLLPGRNAAAIEALPQVAAWRSIAEQPFGCAGGPRRHEQLEHRIKQPAAKRDYRPQ